MMRLILTTCCAIAVLLGCVQCSNKKNAETASTSTNDLPTLTVIKADGSKFDLRKAEGKTILVFFNPECDHCQRVAEQIKLKKKLFSNHQVYFVSTETQASLQKFAQQYELQDENFLFVQADADDVFQSVGNLPSVPAIFIYQNQNFIRRFDGETSLDVIQQFL
jgi:thiol-disulfide isomerase/thioredoxin